jgi:hypothetical protein
MAFYKREILEEIQARVGLYYVDAQRRNAWNKDKRSEDDLRLVTGYAWIEKGGRRRIRGGFKTESAALRDAYYVVLQGLEIAPGMETGPRLVKRRAA